MHTLSGKGACLQEWKNTKICMHTWEPNGCKQHFSNFTGKAYYISWNICWMQRLPNNIWCVAYRPTFSKYQNHTNAVVNLLKNVSLTLLTFWSKQMKLCVICDRSPKKLWSQTFDISVAFVQNIWSLFSLFLTQNDLIVEYWEM